MMDEHDEYAEYMRATEPVTQSWRERRDIAVKAALDAQAAAERLEKEAKAERATYRRATEVVLPELMKEVGETKSTTAEGIPLTYSKGYGDISLAADKNPKRVEALQWLDDHHGDVVVNKVVIDLGKESATEAAAIVALIREHHPDVLVRITRDANTQTVSALANELYRDGKEFPIQLFNGREREVVKIGKPKVK